MIIIVINMYHYLYIIVNTIDKIVINGILISRYKVSLFLH